MMMMITECLRTIGQKYTLWPKICRHLTMTPMCGPFPSKTSPTYDCLDRLCLWLSFFHHDDVPEHKARSVKTWFGKAHGKPTVCNSILMPCIWSRVLSKHILYGVGRCPNTLDHVVCVCVCMFILSTSSSKQMFHLLRVCGARQKWYSELPVWKKTPSELMSHLSPQTNQLIRLLYARNFM